MTFDGGLASFAEDAEIQAPVSYDVPPRTFEAKPTTRRRYRMAAPNLLRRDVIRTEPFSCVSEGSFANLLEVLSREIDNTLSVSSSDVDIISHYEAQIDAGLRGASVQPNRATENLFEIKRLTGFSWSKIAEIVGVDRRSVTSWVGGGEIRDRNAQAISEALATLRFIDRGSAEENREALETEMAAGRSAFDFLVEGIHDAVRTDLGAGSGRYSLTSAAAEDRDPGRGMLMHPGADPDDTTVLPPDDKPEPPMRPVKAKRM